MKRFLPLLLIVCALSLTACTRSTELLATASPTVQATSTPVLPTGIPDMPDIQPTVPEGDPQTNGTQALKDGVYAAEMSESYAAAQGQGWQDYLKLTVVNGIIDNIEFDSLKDGKKKSAVSTEEYPMDPPPSEWIPQLNEAIRKAELPEAMDTITGATRSSADARRMYAALLEHARTGNTDIVVLYAQ